MSEILLSRGGYEKIVKELQALQQERVNALENLNAARDMGDLSENAEYDAAKKRLIEIDTDIMKKQRIIKDANIIYAPTANRDTINILAYFTLKSTKTGKEMSYQIVSSEEADIQSKKISSSSPLGKAIFNKKIGDIVSYDAPIGRLEFEIIDVHYE